MAVEVKRAAPSTVIPPTEILLTGSDFKDRSIRVIAARGGFGGLHPDGIAIRMCSTDESRDRHMQSYVCLTRDEAQEFCDALQDLITNGVPSKHIVP